MFWLSCITGALTPIAGIAMLTGMDRASGAAAGAVVPWDGVRCPPMTGWC